MIRKVKLRATELTAIATTNLRLSVAQLKVLYTTYCCHRNKQKVLAKFAILVYKHFLVITECMARITRPGERLNHYINLVKKPNCT